MVRSPFASINVTARRVGARRTAAWTSTPIARRPAYHPLTALVVAHGGEELAAPGERRQPHRRDGAAAARLLPRLGGVRDTTGQRHAVHAAELDPLDMAHHRRLHPTTIPRASGGPVRRCVAGEPRGVPPGAPPVAGCAKGGDRWTRWPPGRRGSRPAPQTVGERHRRRPTGTPPPLPRSIGMTGKIWLIVMLVMVVVGALWLRLAPYVVDHIDGFFLRPASELRTPWLEAHSRAGSTRPPRSGVSRSSVSGRSCCSSSSVGSGI